jgi:hypothetical protein
VIFPPPWSVEDVGAAVQRAAFVVKDANGQALAYVPFEDEPGRRSRLGAADRGEYRQAAGLVEAVWLSAARPLALLRIWRCARRILLPCAIKIRTVTKRS